MFYFSWRKTRETGELYRILQEFREYVGKQIELKFTIT